VEADIKSGTFITVEIAKNIGRDIFAVPGPINCYASRGANRLIADKRAKMLESVDDILKYFGKSGVYKTKKPHSQISIEQQSILNILKTNTVHFDDIIEEFDGDVKRLSSLLTNMELCGLIEKLPGNMFAAV
jgi:DNA processing protein